MSEYQYYEFQAIDRPLTNEQIRELRRYSSRAEITSTTFAVEYNWGDFKGNPTRWMEQYFDAFVHVANWGTRWFMLRIPNHLLNPEMISEYCVYEYFSFNTKGSNVILSFRSDEEDGKWVDGEGWLSSLVPLRADLMRGDHRCLYLAWLSSIQGQDYEDDDEADDVEPPVPAGLRNLSGPMERFVDFLGIDFDVIAAAAEQSQSEQQLKLSKEEITAWVRRLSLEEKDNLLVRVIEGDVLHPGAELRQRALRALSEKRAGGGIPEKRRIAQILARADAISEDRRRIKAEKAAREKIEREQEQSEKRQRHLESLRGSESDLWSKANQLIITKQPKRYDEAVSILLDLHDLADKEGTSSVFMQRMDRLWREHASKPTLLERLRKARLSSSRQGGTFTI